MVTGIAPRAVAEHEWPALREAANRVFRPDGARDMFADYPLLFAAENRDNLRVIAADGGEGQILAHAGLAVRGASVLRRRIRVAFVGAVFTAATHRGQGMGGRVLSDALARARRDADLVLVSGDRSLYRRSGLEPIPPLARFRLHTGNSGATQTSAAPAVTVRELAAADLPVASALYEAEEVRFDRSLDDWRRLCAAGLLIDVPATIWMVRRLPGIGEAAAYLAVQHAGRRADGSVRPRRVLEVAGDRAAAVEAAPLVADELLLPPYDRVGIALAERKGWVRTARQFEITAEARTPEVVVIPWYGLNYL